MATYDSGLVYCTSGSGSGWTNAGNITANDDNYATKAMDSYGYGELLGVFSSSAFSGVPDSATITGVEVCLGVKASSSGSIYTGVLPGGVYYGGVLLRNGETEIGQRKPTTQPSFWGTSEAQEIYGGSSDLWGATIDVALLKSGSFSIYFLMQNGVGSTRTAYVDYVAARVYATYTEEATPFIPPAVWF